MDAKDVLDGFALSKLDLTIVRGSDAWRAIKSALSLAAAVEGPEEACPDVEAWFYGVITRNGRELNLLAADAHQFARKLANERNAALRALNAERERAKDQFGWLVENGKQGNELRYRCMRQGIVEWTADHNEAMRFARRIDAEAFCAEDEDAWRVVEHAWHALAAQEGRHD